MMLPTGWALAGPLVTAGLAESDAVAIPVESAESLPMFRYGEKGFEFESEDGSTFLWLGLRLQMRYDSLPGQVTSTADFHPSAESEYDVNRARIKGGGHLFSEDFEIYSEYDFPSDRWLDYRATWHFADDFFIRVGQWKSEFNRERIDSSGAQQFVDRSLANYWFTLDRQLGAAVGGRVGRERWWDSSVWLEYLSGRGLGSTFRSDSGLGMLRWQWNPQGEVVGFGQADLKRSEEFVSAVTLGSVYGDTHFTRFTSSGGEQLPGFGYGDYRLTQLMFETAARWRGVSWQQELHWKHIEDLRGGDRTEVMGGYAQVGVFPSECWRWFPEPLELVTRISRVDPDISLDGNAQWEWMFGGNWYFDGHRNKVSADVALLDLDDSVTGSESEWRLRLQWDVSF